MRVAYVCADAGVPVFGRKGCSIHVREVVRALGDLGAEIDLFGARLGGAPPRWFGGRVHHLPLAPVLTPEARERAGLANNRRLRAAIRSAGPFDLVYERYSLWSHAGLEAARQAGIPGLLEVNAPLLDEQAAHRGLYHREIAERVADRVFAAATALVAVSEGVGSYLGERGQSAERIRVIPNGVDPSRFGDHVRPCRSPEADVFTIGFVGTLKPWHGLPTLVEAFARISRRRRARLLIVGDGPERARLEADVTAHGLDGQVLFTGAVDPDEIPGWLASMDVAVAPYPPAAGFYFSPLKVYEYMAAGLPVVASRIGQLRTVIRSGFNGVLCPPGDERALAEALDGLGRNRGLRAAMGRAGRAMVEHGHTWQSVAREILECAGLEPIQNQASGRRRRRSTPA